MKQSPDLSSAQARMAPGVLTMDGFLGSDRRDLIEILQDDDGEVRRCGATHQEIAAALGTLTEAAVGAFGAVVDQGPYAVCACEAMGRIPCPFGHAGLYTKAVIEGRRRDTGQALTWTALQVHLIEAHGFYEGRGSPYRLEPRELAEFLGLPAPREAPSP